MLIPLVATGFPASYKSLPSKISRVWSDGNYLISMINN